MSDRVVGHSYRKDRDGISLSGTESPCRFRGRGREFRGKTERTGTTGTLISAEVD